jgi:hypothetical protein
VMFHLDPSEMALGISTVQGFVPSVQRHSTRRRALPPCRWCLRHSPGFPGCHDADPRLRGLVPQRRCRVPRVVLPTLGSRSPLQVLSSSGTRISLLAPVDRSRRFRPLMALVLRTLSSPKRTPRSGPLACSVLRGRWFGARLRDLPPHSRFRAFDPLTQLSRRCQSLGWSVGLSRGAERFLFPSTSRCPAW